MSKLENEIASALTSDAITVAELQSLVARALEAIANADAEAKREESRVYDPQLCPDPKAAKDALENALLTSGRLQTLLTRLRRKRAAVADAERLAAWEADFKRLKSERNVLADELVAVYPELTAKLIDLFTRIVVFDGKLGELHQSRPSGVGAHLTGAELEARQLESFSRDRPPIVKQIILYDLASGKQVWPPIVRRDLSSTIQVINEVGRNAEWWRPEFKEARAAEAARENKRLADFYESKEKERVAAASK
jgi:hypothetical protein